MGVLAARNLTRYFGGLAAVEDVSFVAEAGEIVALIGPNGAGKTTVFNLITGVFAPTRGTVQYRDRVLNGLPTHAITGLGISRTFQNLELFNDLTVLDNVLIGCYPRGRTGFLAAGLRLPSAIAEDGRLRFEALEKLTLLGLDQRADEMAGNLPFGQQRLLEIARALAPNPDVLLLDEPVAGLNAEEAEGLAGLIRRLRAGGMTVLLVEHDMKTVMGLADRIVVLNHGRQIAVGTPAEIQADETVIAAYLGVEEA